MHLKGENKYNQRFWQMCQMEKYGISIIDHITFSQKKSQDLEARKTACGKQAEEAPWPLKYFCTHESVGKRERHKPI